MGDLRVAEPPKAPPWETFLVHSVMSITVAVLAPLGLQVLYEAYMQHPDRNVHQDAVYSSTFLPYGLYLGSALVFVFYTIRLWSKKLLRELIDQEVSAMLFGGCAWWRSKTQESKNQPVEATDVPLMHNRSDSCFSIGNGDTRRSEDWFTVRSWGKGLRLFLFVLGLSCVPLIAWADRTLWTTVVADKFHSCAHLCQINSMAGHNQTNSTAGHKQTKSTAGHKNTKSTASHNKTKSTAGHNKTDSTASHKKTKPTADHKKTESTASQKKTKPTADHKKTKSLDLHTRIDFGALCTNTSLDRVHNNSMSNWKEIEQNPVGIVFFLFSGLQRPGEMTEESCRQIMEEEETQFIEALVRRDQLFPAFEARFRASKHIGVFEIYGAAFAIMCFLGMVSSRIALRSKLRTLNNAKKSHIVTHFMKSVEDSNKYFRLFERLYRLQYGPNTKDSYFVLEALRVGGWGKDGRDYRRKETKRVDEDALFQAVGTDDDADGRLDDRTQDSCCDREAFQAASVGIIFAGVHVAIPPIFRAASTWEGAWHTFDDAELRPALVTNVLVEFIFLSMLVAKFMYCIWGFAEKFQQTVAFNCMWRFPGEDPMKNVLRDDQPLHIEVELASQKQDEGKFSCPSKCHQNSKTKDLEQGKMQPTAHHSSCDDKDVLAAIHDGFRADGGEKFFFHTDSYRARFGVLQSQHLWQELYKLQEWFRMRHYIQVDNFDERIAMELAMIVALGSLVPKVAVITYNWIVLSSGQFSLQAVNLVTLWDFLFVVAYIFRSLMITLAFNDMYDLHGQHLQTLMHHVKLEAKKHQEKGDTAVESKITHTNHAGEDEEVYTGPEAIILVQSYIDALSRFDQRSAFLGLPVDRKVITGFSSTAVVLLLPQILSVLDQVRASHEA